MILHLTNEQVIGYVKNEDKIFDAKLEIKEIKRELKVIKIDALKGKCL